MTTAARSYCVIGAVTALASLLWVSLAHAQSYPARPIQVIVPYAGGSASDVVTRILLERTAKTIGQPFIIDNRPGAGGNTGTLAGARATPDGYTLVATGSGPVAANKTLYQDLGYDPEKDFEPVSLVGVFPIVVVASSKLPVKTLTELIAYAKERPGSSITARWASAARSIWPALISSRLPGSSSPTCLTATSRNTRRT